MRLRRFGWPVLAVVAVVGGWAVAVREMAPPAVAADYTQIEPGLYVGARVDKPPNDAAAVLNLCEQPDDYPMAYEKFSPIADAAPAPSLDWLKEQVNFISAQRAAGRVVFVHCNAGKSRSVMVAAAYLMQRDHMGVEEAIGRLRARRPVVHPIPAFVDLLRQWGQSHGTATAAASTLPRPPTR